MARSPLSPETILLVGIGAAALILGWGPQLAVLLITLGVWLVAYRMLSAAEREMDGKPGVAYRLLQKFEKVAKQKAQLLLLLGFLLICYFFWLFTGRMIGSFLLAVFAFSAGTMIIEKGGRKRITASDLLFPLVLLAGTIYSFLRWP